MQGRDGHFYYRIYPWGKAKTPMLHWAQATIIRLWHCYWINLPWETIPGRERRGGIANSSSMSYIMLVFAVGLAFVCLRQDAKLELERLLRNLASCSLDVASGFASFGKWLPGQGNQWVEQIILSAHIARFIVLAQRSAKVSALFRENRLLLLFLGYMTLSILWSDDISSASIRWFRAVGDVTMALLVLTEPNPFVALLCVLRRAIVVLIPVSLVLCMYFPDLGRGREIHGPV